ncbi:DUF4432 domain-containing protein [Siphonobacter sp. BAB-5385]|uniref:aldose 1-epimerase family protein n=1 Tax=Siphonobacter sp. BAB-5385 TaxID=1864822 RepID=UPI000B9DE9FE|nr:aldose 1-epimerase family protein [Siphonobacter sp. BAB-5385]OZI09750.1 DUF4432 domain-containing protein [Siphonobacter sp. BAB-5385]
MAGIDQRSRDKISNPAQLGGIETSVLDNGPGRGNRIAWVNTGAGLRYKVVLDRGMDIAEAFYQQHSLAWLSHGGITTPQPFSNRGLGWLRTFGGGLLTTCGLTHVGGPESDEWGERGLHDTFSNTPAELECITQPDPFTGQLVMSVRGRIRQSQALGTRLELSRTLSSTLGKASLRLRDEIVNRGNTTAPHMLLYHINLGWPLIDEGTRLLWRGSWEAGSDHPQLFRPEHDFRTCPAPLDAHAGAGEEVAFINLEADDAGQCQCGVYNETLGLALVIRFYKQQLPWLTNWQHWGKGEYVTGLEPGTHPPMGQAQARATRQLIWLEPGERRVYELEIEVLTDPQALETLFMPYH